MTAKPNKPDDCGLCLEPELDLHWNYDVNEWVCNHCEDVVYEREDLKTYWEDRHLRYLDEMDNMHEEE